MTRRTPRRVLLALLLVAVSTMVALLAVELILRQFGLAPANGLTTVDERAFARIPGLFAPGQDFTNLAKPQLPHRIRIDSLGYRGPDFPRRKPAGELRILMLGDSFTFGDFVDTDSSYPAQLERRLNRSGCPPVRVVNAGVGGSTLPTAQHMFERAVEIEPDIVVLTFSDNDVSDLAHPLWPELAANRRLKSRFPMSVVYGLLHETAIWHLALRTKATVGIQAAGDAGARTPDKSDELNPQLSAAYRREFAVLASAVKRQSLSLVTVLFSSHRFIRRDTVAAMQEFARAVFDSAGYPPVDLREAFMNSGRDTSDLYLLPFDGHATPLGNRIAAEAVAARLQFICSAS